MAMGWDEIISQYKEMLDWRDNFATRAQKDVYTHAVAMLDLIPAWRHLPLFEGVMPYTSHYTLVLKLPDKTKSTHVFHEGNGRNRVSFYDATVGEIGEERHVAIVSDEALLDTVDSYLKMIRDS